MKKKKIPAHPEHICGDCLLPRTHAPAPPAGVAGRKVGWKQSGIYMQVRHLSSRPGALITHQRRSETLPSHLPPTKSLLTPLRPHVRRRSTTVECACVRLSGSDWRGRCNHNDFKSLGFTFLILSQLTCGI